MFKVWTTKAGRVTLGFNSPLWLRLYVYLHLLPRKARNRRWGYKQDWYDGPYHSFGIGPLLLVCWHE